jgi:hypothetical protein
MEWKTLRVYIIGAVDQALLLRIAYVVTEHRILPQQVTGACDCVMGSGRLWQKWGKSSASRRWRMWLRSSSRTPAWPDMRWQYHTRLADAPIAATALSRHLPLSTRHLQHFTPIEGVRIEKPYD